MVSKINFLCCENFLNVLVGESGENNPGLNILFVAGGLLFLELHRTSLDGGNSNLLGEVLVLIAAGAGFLILRERVDVETELSIVSSFDGV